MILIIVLFLAGIPASVSGAEMAPNFQLQTPDRTTLSLKDLKGKKVVLNFWATWCPPCKEEIPELVSFYKNNHDQVEILAVHVDNNQNIKEFVQQYGMKFPVVIDRNSLVSNLYGVFVVPTTFFIDENGYVRARHMGPLNQEQLHNYLKQMTF